MNNSKRFRTEDLIVFSLANLMNLIMVAIFLLRAGGSSDHVIIIGWVWVIFILVLTGVVVSNIRNGREGWTYVLPCILIAFLALEIVLDYILKVEFRTTRLLGPYLLLYYAAIFGMIGYSFRIGKKYGFITLITYFISQIAALYSYTQVGHG